MDDLLRSHDPAHDVPSDLARSPRATATLARVLATEPGPGRARPGHRKRVARYALATSGVMETSEGAVSSTQFLVAGRVGAEVTRVVFETQDMKVEATVQNGYFTAWWPQRKPASIVGRVLDNTGYNGSPNPKVTITLANGSTFTRHIKDYDVNQ